MSLVRALYRPLLSCVLASLCASGALASSPSRFAVAPGMSASQIIARAASIGPTPQQLRWQHEELTAFVHFGPDTYTGLEIGTGTERPNIVDPQHFDPDGWMRVLHDAGFKKVMFTAKHHDGFVLWPSRYTRFGIAASRWRGGHGDMVGEVVRAARRHGLLVAFYLSPADIHESFVGGSYANGSLPKPSTIPTLVRDDDRHPPRFYQFVVDDYNRYYLNQLYELLTQYGPIDEVFLDGYNPLKQRPEPYDFEAWYRLIRALQPQAVMFGGPDVNWVGDEDGVARQAQWSVVAFNAAPRPDQTTAIQDPTDPHAGDRASLLDRRTREIRWYPSECDARLESTWFWHPTQPPKSLAQLITMYYTSVGRNCQLILDTPPDKSGRLDAADIARLGEFGRWLQAHAVHDLAAGVTAARSGETTVYTLRAPTRFQTVGFAEVIEGGQRVESFTVDADLGDGSWRTLARGETIGYKRLLRLEHPFVARRLRLRIIQARASVGPVTLVLYR
jgi:alpha-L-fucosidase